MAEDAIIGHVRDELLGMGDWGGAGWLNRWFASCDDDDDVVKVTC